MMMIMMMIMNYFEIILFNELAHMKEDVRR